MSVRLAGIRLRLPTTQWQKEGSSYMPRPGTSPITNQVAHVSETTSHWGSFFTPNSAVMRGQGGRWA